MVSANTLNELFPIHPLIQALMQQQMDTAWTLQNLKAEDQ